MTDELDELADRLTAYGWQKLPPPAFPSWQRPGPDGVECLYSRQQALMWLAWKEAQHD
jgi:hypothetical protein